MPAYPLSNLDKLGFMEQLQQKLWCLIQNSNADMQTWHFMSRSEETYKSMCESTVPKLAGLEKLGFLLSYMWNWSENEKEKVHERSTRDGR